MIPDQPQSRPRPIPPKQDDVDLGKLFFLMLSNWPWFALAIVIFLSSAWVYIRFTVPTWSTSATVLIEEGNKGQSVLGSDKILEGFGLRPGMQNLDNQLLILTSRRTIEKTLAELPFDNEYYYRGKINKMPLYPESPIRVIADTTGKVPRDVEYEFNLIDDNSFNLEADFGDLVKFHTKASFGDTIDVRGGKLRIEKMPDGFMDEFKNRSLYFTLHSRDKLADSYRAKLKAAPASKEGTIINISLEGTNRQMDADFLGRLIQVFLNNNLEKKNLEAVRTINFIDEQLLGISDSLNITEDKLQKFRSENRVMDMSAQGQQIIEHAMQLENERAKLVIESNYYGYLTEYLSKNTGELPIAPATMGITDPGLTRLVVELTDLQSQYYSKSFTDKNPMQALVAQRLRNTKDALSETLRGVTRANELAMKENREQIRSVNASAATLPKTERELLGIERQFKLNDVLYSFLIEKKAEAQIQKASNTPDNEIVDSPKPAKDPVAPSPMKTYLIALLAALGLPFITILFLKSINNIVKDEEELKKITDLPIAGHIPHGEVESRLMVLSDPSSNIAEAFRSLRARIQFFTRETKSPVILVTSSMPEEGKTFTAINLASIYSLMGKKTILVGFDLRKPKIYGDFKIPNDKGISTWLIGRDNLEDVIVKSSHQDLDILPAGPIPPNPAELILSEKTAHLIAELKNRYEFIVIDSAPIGTVADSMTLSALSDATIILVRHGRTIAPLLSSTLEGIKANGINGMSILVNDIQSGKLGYGYYTKYGYDYRYNYTTTKKSR
jgi:capsular exopolysaccharide synthesis family protein